MVEIDGMSRKRLLELQAAIQHELARREACWRKQCDLLTAALPIQRPRGQEPFSMPRGHLCLQALKKVPDPLIPQQVALVPQQSLVTILDNIVW